MLELFFPCMIGHGDIYVCLSVYIYMSISKFIYQQEQDMRNYSKEEDKPLLSKCWVALQVCAPFSDTQWFSPWPGSPHPPKRPADEPATTSQHPQGRSHKDVLSCKGMEFYRTRLPGKTGLHHACEMLSQHTWFSHTSLPLQ